MECDVTVNSNMLTLVDTREVVCQYTDYFGAILEKRLVNVLTTDHRDGMDTTPSLLGALGAMVKEVPRRSYNCLTIITGNALTYNHGKSPYCEVYDHPFSRMVNFTYETPPQGKVILPLPLEYWGGPDRDNSS